MSSHDETSSSRCRAASSSEAIRLGRAGGGKRPVPYRPDRDLLGEALEFGILQTRLVDGATKTVVDSRGIGTNPGLGNRIVSGMIMNVEALGGDLIAGVANSGTLLAGLIGHCSGLDFCNVLIDGRRKSGLMREVEPDDVSGREAVLVDNYLNSGKSLHQAAEILSRHGAEVVGIAVVSAPTDYESFTSASLTDCPLRVMWPMDMLRNKAESIKK